MKKITKKPPLGVMPKQIWQEIRFAELQLAIKRYCDDEINIPFEWIVEYSELAEIILGLKPNHSNN